MFDVKPSDLADARCQLHWASQLLCAAADAKLEKADDDSHSNFGWNASECRLEGRAGVALDVVDFRLEIKDDSFSLRNQTLEASAVWLGGKIQGPIKYRDFGIPQHDVSDSGVFAPNASHLTAIAEWFSFGQKTLESNGELRVWPHHFDLGFWKPTEFEGKSLGGGLVLGDNYYEQPYFYINPYGIDRPETLPDLSHGHWTQHWTGAVLTASELQGGDPEQVASLFAQEAIKVCMGLLD